MSKYKSYLVSGFTLATIILSVAQGLSLLFAFSASLIFSIIVLAGSSGGVKALAAVAWDNVLQYRVLYLFILLIGANISVWMASGIVPAVMYYGFEYLAGTNFLLVAFLITGGMSIFMGTAVGTISTLGIALLGIGRGFGIPQGVLLGGLVSGAFLADKISPISGLLNLTMKVTELNYRQLFKSMAKTLLPVLAITGMVYLVLGARFPVSDSNLILQYQESIQGAFNISPLLLLLPLAVILLPLFGVKTMPAVLAGLAGGGVLTLALQKTSLPELLDYILWGYKAASQSQDLNTILVSGGIRGMAEIVLIVIAIIALSGVLEQSGVLRPLLHKPIAAVTGRGELIFKTGIISMLLSAVTCDQTAGIILQGQAYRAKFRETGLGDAILARTISDTGTIVAPLIPWNVNALIIGLATGISALEYAPYAALCYIFPVWTLVFVPLLINKSPEPEEMKNREVLN